MNKIETLQGLLYNKEEMKFMGGFQKEAAKLFNNRIKNAIELQETFNECDSS